MEVFQIKVLEGEGTPIVEGRDVVVSGTPVKPKKGAITAIPHRTYEIDAESAKEALQLLKDEGHFKESDTVMWNIQLNKSEDII
jgi:hypothetical protein